MVSINANTGLLFTPVDYEDDVLQSARDRVYTIKGERSYRPNYGLVPDYAALYATPVAFIQQAFKTDSRLNVTHISSVYPELNVRGITTPNPIKVVSLTSVTSNVTVDQGRITFEPDISMYVPNSWIDNRTTVVLRIGLEETAVTIMTDEDYLDLEDDNVYDPWYIYLKSDVFSWLIPITTAPSHMTTSPSSRTYHWQKDVDRLAPIRAVVEAFPAEKWTLAFVRIENWLKW